MNTNKIQYTKKRPFVLTILDGFGYSDNPSHNAIKLANTPTLDKLWQQYPHCLLDCSGKAVGLPDNQMGNSEVGHMNISAGRVIYQDLTRIDLAIQNGDFFNNQNLVSLITDSKEHSNENRCLQICGLVSDGGVHSHINHFIALINLAKQHNINNLYIHAFLDGRDTAPKSALASLKILNELLVTHKIGKIVSIIGRYYAMDRDNRLERTTLAYNLLTSNFNADDPNCFIYDNLDDAIAAAYNRGETDEFVKPTMIATSVQEYDKYKVKSKDNLLFMNFRADRARQLSHMLLNSKDLKLNKFATLTQFEANLTKDVLFNPINYTNMLGEFISKSNLTQLRISETEKYAHVTFFFNGGQEHPFNNEDRILIPSPKVSTYNLKPEMSAFELTDELCKNIEAGKYDFIVCNFPNPDMVGHTGDLDATIKAIEVIDNCIAKIVSAINNCNGQLFITADHGNAECMYNEQTGQVHTAHTNSFVPLIYINNKINADKIKITSEYGSLIDIAPSILHLMQLPIPKEMTGKIIFKEL